MELMETPNMRIKIPNPKISKWSYPPPENVSHLKKNLGFPLNSSSDLLSDHKIPYNSDL